MRSVLKTAVVVLLAGSLSLRACGARGAAAPSVDVLPKAEAIQLTTQPLIAGDTSLTPWQSETCVKGGTKGDNLAVILDGRGTTAAWYAVRAQYDRRSVPYLAPYDLTLTTSGADCWLALYDHVRQKWTLAAGPLPRGTHRVEVGLDPNAAGMDGAFRFAVLTLGGRLTLSHIGLRYPEPPKGALPVDYKVYVNARDGTLLATDVYMPYAGAGLLPSGPPYPIILVRTPYPKEYVGAEYVSWVTRFNAVVVLQYFRGRPTASPAGGAGLRARQNSGGNAQASTETRPTNPNDLSSGGQPGLFDDHAGPAHYDAIDTVRWLRGRSFSSGQLLLAGGSALGLWIYQALPGLGKDATAAYCIAAAGDVGGWATMQNGCFKLGNVEGWLQSFDFPPSLLAQVRAEARQPERWAALDFNAQASKVQIPCWHETGWWDVDVEETIRSFKALNEQGGLGARGQQWIVIGPWTHEGLRSPQAGDLTFGFNSVEQNPTLLPLQWEGGLWSAWELGHNPFYSPPHDHVRAYFVGEEGNTVAPNNTWYALPTWPPKSKPLTFSINGGKLLQSDPSAAWQARFDCDPRNPIPNKGGANLPLGGQESGPYDQRSVEKHAGVITLRTDPLAQRLTVAGPVDAQVSVSTDAVDTDVIVKLLDVYPDGRAILIADHAMRLSWWCKQQGFGTAQPGRVYDISYTVAQRAWVFERGHRIGIDVQASNYPRFDVNPGTGEPLSGGPSVVQHNTLLSAPGHVSGITLPLFNPSQR